MGRDDAAIVLGAGVFDGPPRASWVERFLSQRSNHLLMALVDTAPAGFVSGMEVSHPDKPVEMLLYELGVDEPFRGRGIGTALTAALRDHAIEMGCRGMWVPLEPDNTAATATYRAAGAGEPEPAMIQTWRFGNEVNAGGS